MENEIPRRDFLKGAVAVAAGVALANTGVKVEAAKSASTKDVYASLVNAFAKTLVSSADNVYGVQVTMGSVEQFCLTYNGSKFIYNHYANCVKNKKMDSLAGYYKDNAQKDFLKECEKELHDLSISPNDKTAAKKFLKYVASNMIIKSNQTVEGEFANFDPHYLKDVILFETVCEMVQVAWEKIPAIKEMYKNTKPEDMWEKDSTDSETVQNQKDYLCGQVIVDMCCGRSDNSDRNINLRRSGITKGNSQYEELIMLNYFAPNDDIKKMVMRSLYTIYTKEEMCIVLGMDGAKYDSLMNECGLSLTNGFDEENSVINAKATTPIVLYEKYPEQISNDDINVYEDAYFEATNRAASIYKMVQDGFASTSDVEKVMELSKIYDVDMYADVKGKSLVRKIA